MRTRKQHRNRLRNKNINHHTYHEDLPDYLKLWIFRILWDLGGYREFFNPFGFKIGRASCRERVLRLV